MNSLSDKIEGPFPQYRTVSTLDVNASTSLPMTLEIDDRIPRTRCQLSVSKSSETTQMRRPNVDELEKMLANHCPWGKTVSSAPVLTSPGDRCRIGVVG